MYLTDKRNGIQREPSDHQELEVLLESFAKQVEEIVNETETTQVRSVSFPRDELIMCTDRVGSCRVTCSLRKRSWN